MRLLVAPPGLVRICLVFMLLISALLEQSYAARANPADVLTDPGGKQTTEPVEGDTPPPGDQTTPPIPTTPPGTLPSPTTETEPPPSAGPAPAGSAPPATAPGDGGLFEPPVEVQPVQPVVEPVVPEIETVEPEPTSPETTAAATSAAPSTSAAAPPTSSAQPTNSIPALAAGAAMASATPASENTTLVKLMVIGLLVIIGLWYMRFMRSGRKRVGNPATVSEK